MASPQFAVCPASFDNGTTNLIASDATAAKVLVQPQAAAAGSPTSPAYYGGATGIDITAASTDSAAKDLIIWHGRVLSTQGADTGAVTTTTSTVARASGSFITDGWLPGDLLMVFGDAAQGRQAGVDGVQCIVTAVSATTLTLNGTPLAAATLNSGARLCRVAYDLRATIAAGSGTNGSAPSVSLLNHANDGSILRTERKLGPTELLAVSAVAAVSALPAYININAQFARY